MLYYEPWKHYTKWTKPVVKDHILCNSIYMKYLEQATPLEGRLVVT